MSDKTQFESWALVESYRQQPVTRYELPQSKEEEEEEE